MLCGLNMFTTCLLLLHLFLYYSTCCFILDRIVVNYIYIYIYNTSLKSLQFLGLASYHSMDEMPRAALDPLVAKKVIGDVLDMFVPAAELAVQYGGKKISNGDELKPSSAAQKPTLRIVGSTSPNYYTLVS